MMGDEMKTGSTRNYTFQAKNEYRGWVWNQMAARLKGIEDATIFYLVGPAPHDYEVAIKKNFQRKNIIGIDLSSDNIKKLRMAGGIGVCTDLITAIMNYNGRIDGVIADFCCGFERSVISFLHTISACPTMHAKTVISVNVMRGRDYNGYSSVGPECREFLFGNARKRNKWVYEYYITLVCGAYKYVNFKFEKFVKAGLNPKYHSYLSDSGQYFDSVTFNRVIGVNGESIMSRRIKEEAAFRESLNTEICRVGGKINTPSKEKEKLTREKRKMAAAKALQTMEALD